MRQNTKQEQLLRVHCHGYKLIRHSQQNVKLTYSRNCHVALEMCNVSHLSKLVVP